MMRKILVTLLLFSSTCFSTENQHLELLISAEEIAEKVSQIAQKIDEEYQGRELTIVMVMKGSICITADLIRHIQTPFTLEYMKASSYGLNGISTGKLTLYGIENLNLTSKDVLVVDDIFDSGKTMATIVEQLQLKNPKSLKTLVLLAKKIPRQITYYPDYTLFDIEDQFLVGYGLDYKELYRGLPGIYAIRN